MAKRKYEKNVIQVNDPGFYKIESNIGKMVRTFEFGNHFYEKSNLWVECNIFYAPGGGTGGGAWADVNMPGLPRERRRDMPQRHPVDELFMWIGTNPQEPGDLGGEHEFWFGEGKEAEKYTFTKTTCIYVPKNTAHNPNWSRRVDRPYILVVVLCSPHWVGEFLDTLPPGFSPDL